MKLYTRLFLLILLTVYLAGCTSHHSQRVYDAEKASFLQRAIKGKYEQVFHAAQLSLANYPIAVSDMEAGILRTGIIKNEQMWLPPFLNKQALFGHRYTVSIQLLKIKGKEAVQVTIVKDMEHKRSFFEEYQKVKTDGLEEIALFYRMRRELLLQKKINGSQENPQS